MHKKSVEHVKHADWRLDWEIKNNDVLVGSSQIQEKFYINRKLRICNSYIINSFKNIKKLQIVKF